VRTINRGDSGIRGDILSDIAADDALSNQNIDVKVNNGVVTLSGDVDTGYDRVHAKMIASRIRGVRKVNDKIKVNWKQDYRDAALLEKIEKRIQSNWLLSPVKDKIIVQVRRGRVILTGTIYNWGERREAERVAFNTEGMRMVDNRLQVEGYDYPWEDWYIADPDEISLPSYNYDYPSSGYYWDLYYFHSK
jgi:osmotically-inducible protein OsmY